jgi:hypothetical protein
MTLPELHIEKVNPSAAARLTLLLGTQATFHQFRNRLLVGKLLRLEFGVHEVAVERYFKAAPTRGDKREVLDLLLELRQEIGRQTDGLRFVVSHRAVFDFHLHTVPPFGIASLDSFYEWKIRKYKWTGNPAV